MWDGLKLDWTKIDLLFRYYNGRNNHKFSNRTSFIKKACDLYELTEQESCFIWQAFDRATEEWQSGDYE